VLLLDKNFEPTYSDFTPDRNEPADYTPSASAMQSASYSMPAADPVNPTASMPYAMPMGNMPALGMGGMSPYSMGNLSPMSMGGMGPMPMCPPMGNMPFPSAMPMPMSYMPPMPTVLHTMVEPKFMEHLMMHKGQKIKIVFPDDKLEGTLTDVFIDHITVMAHGKKHHIRYHHIMYFEKA
jgi:hypothetical protein